MVSPLSWIRTVYVRQKVNYVQTAHIPWGGHEEIATDYEVLVYA